VTQLWAFNASRFEWRNDPFGAALGAGGAIDRGAEVDDRDFRSVDGAAAIFLDPPL